MYSDNDEQHFSIWFILSVIVGLLIYIAYLGLLQRTLNCVSKERRTISPWLVCVMLIPVVNLLIQFFIVREIADSLRAELNYRKSKITEDRPGYDMGLLMCLAGLAAPFCYYEKSFGYVELIFWLAYWIKIAGFRKELGGPKVEFDNWEKVNAQKENVKSNLEEFRDKLE